MSWRRKFWLDPELEMTRWYWWCEVFKRTSGGAETALSLLPIAFVYRNMVGSGIQSATWNCPETALDPADSVVVRIYCTYYIPPSLGIPYLLDTWQTEQLGAEKLDAAQWTFYYYTALTFDGSWTWTQHFYFDHAALLSRIEGFSWTPYVEPKQWNNIAAWSFNLATRQWLDASNWNFNLNTSQWLGAASWTFNLLTKDWSSVAQWTFNLLTKGWNSIAQWTLTLLSLGWRTVTTWLFTLTEARDVFPFIWIIMAIFIVVCISIASQEKE